MSVSVPALTPRDVERVLLKIGFGLDRQRGSHRVYVQTATNRTVIVPWHNRDLKRGTLGSIIKGTGLTTEEFLARR